MSLKERRERQKEELRQTILDAAREMFADEGYESVSMRKLAEKIEYSPTTIYLYFKDKNELLQQICEETFGKLSRKLEANQRKHGHTFKGLKKGLQTYIEFGLKHPKHYEVTFMLPLMINVKDDYQYEGSMGEKAFEYLRSAVSECMENGELKHGDINVISQSLWAAIHGTTSLLIGHKDFPFVPTDILIDSVINMMLQGLKTKKTEV